MVTSFSRSAVKGSESFGLGPAGLRFRSILVATDCSPASATAVRLAAQLAKEFHARLYVLHAIAPEMYAANLCGPVPELELMNFDSAHDDLHEYAQHIPDLRTVKHKEIVFLGSPADAIQSAGKSYGIDLLVLGSHGRHGLAKLTLGSVAEWAIGRLSYPVLVAGPACDRNMLPLRSILLATSVADHAQRSTQYAASLGQDCNSRLTLMTVLDPFASEQEQARAVQSAEHSLRLLVPSDCHEQCTLKFEVATGEIAPAILHAAQQNKANLLILGARHRAPFSDHRPRTKLTAILRGSRCPVLVVPALDPDVPAASERKLP